jgi:hypothetical protein
VLAGSHDVRFHSPTHAISSEGRAAAAGAVPWRNVVLPAEHGGWGLSAEPVLLGLVPAPSLAGVCLGLATLTGFLSRHPLRLVLMDRRKDARYPRTKLAERVFVGEAFLALLFLGAARAARGSAARVAGDSRGVGSMRPGDAAARPRQPRGAAAAPPSSASRTSAEPAGVGRRFGT